MHITRRTVGATLLAATVGLTLIGGAPKPAAADEDTEIAELQQQVEDATSAYDAAQQRVEELSQEIAANEEVLSKIEAQMPGQKALAATSMRVLYKFSQEATDIIDLVLSAESFDELLSMVEYLDAVHAQNMNEVTELGELQASYNSTVEALSAEREEAEQQQEAAEQALANAVEAREAAQEAARIRAEEEAAEAQAALEAAAAAAGETFTTENGTTVEVSVPESSDTVAASTEAESAASTDASDEEQSSATSERDAFISEWTSRIDAYLAGSALAGQGATFAQAAWDYGVDPRWSPAISCIESSKGGICFRPYNAWGWGSYSFSSWEESIPKHVKYLGSMYGYTISVEAAYIYCPPNADYWYATVLSEMQRI